MNGHAKHPNLRLLDSIIESLLAWDTPDIDLGFELTGVELPSGFDAWLSNC